MKICFITLKDPSDRRSWSGTFYQMYSHLKKEHQVDWIGNVKIEPWKDLLLKGEAQFYRFTRMKKSPENAFFSYCYAQKALKKISDKKYDIIFAPASSTLITFLKTTTPIVYLSDATFELLTNYYPQFSGLRKWQLKEADKIERRTLQRADKIIYSSDWAKNSAVQFYQIPPQKIFVFDFGANLLREPEIDELNFSDSEVCNILFIGMDWIRKGGLTAYNTYQQLKSKGFACSLTIIGCNPKIESEDPNITIIPFLNKNTEKDFNILYNIFLRSHIFLLPTKADCTPIVFSEASAFGIPSISTDTGGVPTVIKNGINGYLLNVNSDAKEFADKIYSIFTDKEQFKKLRVSTRKEFEKRLNWDAWTQNFNDCIKNLAPEN